MVFINENCEVMQNISQGLDFVNTRKLPKEYVLLRADDHGITNTLNSRNQGLPRQTLWAWHGRDTSDRFRW